MNQHPFPPLTPAVFHILLALAKQDYRGSEIKTQIELDSNNIVYMGPGTLYGCLTRLQADRLIQQIERQGHKCYRLTPDGRQMLHTELERYAQAVQIAKRRLTLR